MQNSKSVVYVGYVDYYRFVEMHDNPETFDLKKDRASTMHHCRILMVYTWAYLGKWNHESV